MKKYNGALCVRGWQNLAQRIVKEAFKDLNDPIEGRKETALYYFKSGDYKRECEIIQVDPKKVYAEYQRRVRENNNSIV